MLSVGSVRELAWSALAEVATYGPQTREVCSSVKSVLSCREGCLICCCHSCCLSCIVRELVLRFGWVGFEVEGWGSHFFAIRQRELRLTWNCGQSKMQNLGLREVSVHCESLLYWCCYLLLSTSLSMFLQLFACDSQSRGSSWYWSLSWVVWMASQPCQVQSRVLMTSALSKQLSWNRQQAYLELAGVSRSLPYAL